MTQEELRRFALELAIQSCNGAPYTIIIEAAKAFENYIRGPVYTFSSASGGGVGVPR